MQMKQNPQLLKPIILRKSYDQCVRTFVNWLTPERLKLYPPHIPIFLFIAWGISLYLGTGLTDIKGTIIGSDFLAFYNGGNFYLHDRMNELYDFYAQYLFQRGIPAPVPYKMFHPYISPPFTAAFFSLFSMNSYLTGLIIWWAFGLLLLFVSISILRSELVPLRVYSIPHLFLISFLFFPTNAWFIYGQSTPILLFLYVVFFVMLRRQNDLVAGIALGLLLYKPQLGLALGFVVLVKRRWRALAGGLVGACIWIVIGFATGPSTMVDYLKIMPLLHNILRLKPDINLDISLLFANADLNYPTWGINSFFGFSSLLLDNLWRTGGDILFILLSIFGLLSLAVIWIHTKWEPKTRTWDMTMAGTIALGLLLSPHLFIYDLMLLLLPLGIVWSLYIGGTKGRPLDGGPLLFWSALLYIVCFCGSYISLAQLKLFSLIGLPKFAVQFSIFIVLAWVYVVIRNGKGTSHPQDSST
jgi:hypothetical protein